MNLTPNRAYLIKNRVRLHRESLHHKAVAEVAQNHHSPLQKWVLQVVLHHTRWIERLFLVHRSVIAIPLAPDRRRSSPPRSSARDSRSPSPVRSRQEPSRGRDSRSPSRQRSQPVRFGRVEKIRPDEVNSYSTKRPYESSYDV